MNTVVFSVIAFVAFVYFALSLVALATFYYKPSSNHRHILPVLFGNAIAGVLLFTVNALIEIFVPGRYVLSILPIYEIIIAFVCLILLIWNITSPSMREAARLSNAIDSRMAANIFIFFLVRILICSYLSMFYKGMDDLLTTKFVFVDKGLLAFAIILAALLFFVACLTPVVLLSKMARSQDRNLATVLRTFFFKGEGKLGKKKRFFLSHFELFLAVVWLTLLLLSLLNAPYHAIFIGWALLVIGYSFFYRACMSLVKNKEVIIIKDFLNHNNTGLAIMFSCLGIVYIVLGNDFAEDMGHKIINGVIIIVVIFIAFLLVYLLLKKSSRETEAGYIPELRDGAEVLRLQRKGSSPDLFLPLILLFTVFLIVPLLLISKVYINLYTGIYMLFTGVMLLYVYKRRERKISSLTVAIQWWKHYQIVLGVALVNVGLEFLLIYYQTNYVVFDQSENLLSTVMLLIYLGFDLFLFCAGPIFACYGLILYVLTNTQEFKSKKE